MASNSETGHAKNVANFDVLYSTCVGLGTTFNPAKASIKPPALLIVLTNSKNAMSALNSTLPAYHLGVDVREAAFDPLDKLITRVSSSLKSSDVTVQVIDTAKTYTRKIQGRRAKPKKALDAFIDSTHKSKNALDAFIESTHEQKTTNLEVTPLPVPDHKEISASQLSYDNRLDNLDKLIKLLGSVPQYIPNEADLKVTALTTIYNDLKTKNSAVITATTPLTNARMARNNILYKEKTGLFAIATDVKAYVLSIDGPRSPIYKQVSKLKFKNIK
ncbi:MAG: hypothetical protein A2275_08015 [Bacteroidetes bacterium RIFOXYA12_FULL_35_11]|nr:MAG: hypothetical protein A2X01_14995 [Bacteroidetes bacterium GWF2_35_48]OFY76225.1 MAG: hypothetical protein A2275_08015 [Bacteroidetes bacterium RIFOXYA12_FULL_35_11]OFY94872.1 MAG: hypothetical protein A2491_15075 [Bacteroidetes bacterium RIFOXYC12_FULL_35_7]HBX53046.1 hypothetical protein [Bacteroidales bacterium]